MTRRKTGFFESEGERIYWEDLGEGFPLVLCHGAGGNHAVWYQQVAHFAQHRRVVVWDHRGYGRSTARAGHTTPERAVRDLLGVLDHLGISRADLVGQSMGGWTALGLSVAEPRRVRRLVLADTPGGIPCDASRQLLAAATQSGAGLAPGSEVGQHPAIDASLAKRDLGRAYLYQALGQFGEPDTAQIIPTLLRTERTVEELRKLASPVLFVVGDRDALFPPAAIREVAGFVENSRVVEIPGSGHSPYFEDPAAWNLAVSEFLGHGDSSAV
jgi:pimeloyl-ACP methyl ester carboxylesterase